MERRSDITANSFTSVSLDPPLLLVNVHRQAACAAGLIAADHFAVNVLQTGQQPASIRFSTRQEDRFGANDWSRGEFGAPVLQESLGVFECERYAVHEGGDHHILVGHVVKASFDARLDPCSISAAATGGCTSTSRRSVLPDASRSGGRRRR